MPACVSPVAYDDLELGMLGGQAQQLGTREAGCPDDSDADHSRMIIQSFALSCNRVQRTACRDLRTAPTGQTGAMIPGTTPTKGRLLVATPPLDDPNFDRTVIYVLEHHDEGALGV